MKTKNNTFINFEPQIPEEKSTKEFHKNAWISPQGDFYGFNGAYHNKAAMYLAIFKLGADDKTLKKGTYFNESWEGWML